MRAHLLVSGTPARPPAWSESLFDGTSGVAISAYTPDQGAATWVQHPSAPRTMQLDGTGLARPATTSTHLYHLSANAPTEDVTAVVTALLGTSGASGLTCVWLRLATATSLTGYRISHLANGTAGSARNLTKFVAGTSSTLASWGNAAPSGTLTWTVSVVGNVITVKEGTTTVATVDETSNSPITSGRVGIMVSGSIQASMGGFDTVTVNYS